MLSEQRIKEAETNARSYTSDGLLKRVSSPDINVTRIIIKNCEESLRMAELAFMTGNSPLWAVVCSYYAMFYVANAVLYESGIKVGDKIVHKVTADALIVFVRLKLAKSLVEDYELSREEVLQVAKVESEELLQNFERERAKRSAFQYEMTEEVLKGKAQTSLERAKKFVFELGKMVRRK